LAISTNIEFTRVPKAPNRRYKVTVQQHPMTKRDAVVQ